jgi:secreted trypsin-like serine protease
MRVHSVVLASALALVAATTAAAPALAIRGGVESAQAYSFMGSLQRPFDSPRADGHVCGVTLIAPQWVVTAGHCARNPTSAQVGTPRDWKVRIGSASTTSGGRLVEVDKFYSYSPNPPHDGDLALLHLAAPVLSRPASLPSARPADGASTRIMGWGVTCDQREPRCYPDHLREADTVVQPAAECVLSGITARELCVGAKDGSVAATNMDSGGPAVVRDGDGWTLIGAVSGSNGDDQAVVYTDVHSYLGWIDGIVSGTSVPPDSPVPDLAGAVGLGACSASVVRTPEARPDDPALLLTNGHCVQGDRPQPGSALADQPADLPVQVAGHDGYPQATAKATRLVYATMTGTDVALYRLDTTYAQLEAAGAQVFRLATTAARAGDRVDVVSAGMGKRFSCSVDAVVPHLREAGYQQDGSYRYDSQCGPSHGASGSPLVAADGVTVVGVHNTGNDDGGQCTENNPCEVAADGTVTVHKGQRYGQPTTMLPDCLTAGSVLDLAKPGCTLTRPAA